MRSTSVLALGLAVLLFGAPRVGAEEPQEAQTAVESRQPAIVGTVNGEPLYFEDLERLLGTLHSDVSQTQRRAMDLDQLVFRLVNDQLLAQEARILGMQDEEPIPSRLAALRERLAVERLEREEISAKAKPLGEELQRAFRDEYRTITFRILTVYEKDEAERLHGELEHGADFGALAREHSIDPFGPRDGLVEDMDRIDMPRSLSAEAFGLAPGDLTGPISTNLGWATIRVEALGDPDPERFETLERSLRKLVTYRKAERLRADLGARLRQTHALAVDKAAVDAITSERLPDGRLMPKVPNPAAEVARVGERVITAEEFARALRARWSGVRNETAAAAAKPLILDRLIGERLLLAEALKRGYGDEPEVQRELRASETQMLIPRFLDQVVAASLEVTPEEMETFYQENREGFHRPPRLHVAQITVADEAKATQVVQLLQQGADPAWVAGQHSIDRFKDRGGDRGWLVPGRTGEPLLDGLAAAQAGDVVGPRAGPGGFVVVRIAAREEQGIYAFEEVAGNVRAAVHGRKFQDRLHEYIGKLRSRSEITIDEQTLASMQITGAPEEEGDRPKGMPSDHGG